jgi:RNA polymerase sigma factor (sigma-70 family)
LPKESFYNDCQLLALIKQGDRQAFAVLYKRYWKDLFDQAYKRLKNSQQSEDLIQDVFVSLWLRRAIVEIDNLPAYLHGAVRFRVFNFVKREMVSAAFFEPLEIIVDEEASVDGQLLGKEMIRLIQLFANTLPEKRKQIFLLHFSGNLTSREIAEQLQIKQKTVQNQLGRAVESLKTRFAGFGIFLICLLVMLRR